MQRNSALVKFCDEAETIGLYDFALDLPTQRKFKDSGQMVAPATIARTGIMQYRAGQCGALFADRDPNSTVSIMTEAADLFCKDSIASYHSAPITIEHPPSDVTAGNSKEFQKGHIDGVPFADEAEGMLAASIVLSDSDAINIVEAGTSQLSSGHSCVLVMADAGADYDAKKTMIRANHVAIVARGRAGNAEIADAADAETAETKLADAESRLVLKDGELSIITAQLDASKEDLEKARSKLADSEVRFKDEVESAVKAKLAFLAIASKFTDTDLVGMNEKEAKLLILKDSLKKDFSSKDKVYIDARFDAFLDSKLEEEDDDNNSIAAILADDAKNKEKLVDTEVPAENSKARQKMIDRNSNKTKKEY